MTHRGRPGSLRCVIPSYGVPALALRAIASIRSTATAEVIVVEDTGRGRQPDLERAADSVIYHPENRGFSAAVNTGVRAAGSDVVLVNSDVVLGPGCLDALTLEAASSPRIGVVGAHLLYPDGSIQHAGVVPGSWWHFERGFFHVGRDIPLPKPNSNRDYPAVTGAAMWIRYEAWRDVGGFDEHYFNQMEDLDFCYAVRRNGWRVRYSTVAVAVHEEWGTLGKRDDTSRDHLIERGRRQFREKWSGPAPASTTWDRVTYELERFETEQRALRRELEPLDRRGRSAVVAQLNQARQWMLRVHEVLSEMKRVIPAGSSYLLVDEGELTFFEPLPGPKSLPFPHRAGMSWGKPADDTEAITELQQARADGVSYLVLAWSGFWWLDHYRGFAKHLSETARRLVDTSDAVVFDLAPDQTRPKRRNEPDGRSHSRADSRHGTAVDS